MPESSSSGPERSRFGPETPYGSVSESLVLQDRTGLFDITLSIPSDVASDPQYRAFVKSAARIGSGIAKRLFSPESTPFNQSLRQAYSIDPRNTDWSLNSTQRAAAIAGFQSQMDKHTSLQDRPWGRVATEAGFTAALDFKAKMMEDNRASEASPQGTDGTGVSNADSTATRATGYQQQPPVEEDVEKE